jgi:hypothetical protein
MIIHMKKGLHSLMLLCCAFFFMPSCNETDRKIAVSNTIIPKQSEGILVTPADKTKASISSFRETEKTSCLANIPQRVIDASVLPCVEFKQVDLMGYEKVELPTGDRLLIINWGCESYNLTFRFETSRFGTDTSKIKQWYSILTQLLYVIEPAIDSPVGILRGINEIHNYLKQDTMPVAYNVPLTINRDSTFAEMVFERVKILGDSAVRLDVTFSISSL